MIIEINGRERQLRFDLGFIRQLDKIFQAEAHDMKFPMGLVLADMQLQQNNAAALADVIRCALHNKVSAESVDDAVYKYAEDDRLAELFEEVRSEMGKSPVVKSQLKKAEEQSE